MKPPVEPRLTTLSSTTLIGLHTSTSQATDQPSMLWRQFMPRLREIEHRLGQDLYSVQVYPNLAYFQQFDPTAAFEKWAAVAVTDTSGVPPGMVVCELAGLYAVFTYQGRPQDFAATAQYIYAEWLPNSAYALDSRPHFSLMGEQYRGDDPASEEEIWVPVRPRA